MDSPLKILAVDNEPNVTLSLRYVFDGPRYEVMAVDSGAAALNTLNANPGGYDIMIVDQKMPGLSGTELVQAVKQQGFEGKIIVVSAHLSTDVRESYERMGVRAMFPKPFDVGLLRSAVEQSER